MELVDDVRLSALCARWERQRAPVCSALLPGLTDAEIDETLRPLGLSLPEEARRWWRWHNGTRPSAPVPARQLGPGHIFLTLAEAVTDCEMYREVASTATEGEGGALWKASWLPMTSHKGPPVIDCSGPLDSPAPVRSFSFEEPDAGAEGVGSIAELIALWCQAMESGAWRFDGNAGHWLYDWTALPPAVEQLRLT